MLLIRQQTAQVLFKLSSTFIKAALHAFVGITRAARNVDDRSEIDGDSAAHADPGAKH